MLVGDHTQTGSLEAWFPRLAMILLLWMLFGPVIDTPWTTLARRRP